VSTVSAASSCSTTPSSHPRTSTRSALLEEHLAAGWECDVEVVVDAPGVVPDRAVSPELQEAARVVGQRLLAAGDSPPV
jgi:hypothetical protein